jgi:hypothetical protein
MVMSSLFRISCWSSSLSRNASCTDDPLHYPGSPISTGDPRIVQNLPFVNVQATKPVTSTWDLSLYRRTTSLSQDQPFYLRSLFLSSPRSPFVLAILTSSHARPLYTMLVAQNARFTMLLIALGFLNVDTLEAVDLLTLTLQRLRANSRAHIKTVGFSYIFIRVLTRLYFGGFLVQLLPHYPP